MNVGEHLGDWLRSQMNAHGYNQNDVMRLSGLSSATISKAATGNMRVPAAETLAALAVAFDVSVDSICREIGILPEREGGDKMAARHDKLNEKITLLDADEIDEVLEYAQYQLWLKKRGNNSPAFLSDKPNIRAKFSRKPVTEVEDK